MIKEIKHTRPGNIALSKHVYGYKPAGNIESWAQTLGTGAAKTWAVSYDKADQLEAATQTQGATVTAQQAFRFDRIGNITSKQDGSEISKGTFNNRNQLTAQEPGGWMRVRGTTYVSVLNFSSWRCSGGWSRAVRRLARLLPLPPLRPPLLLCARRRFGLGSARRLARGWHGAGGA